jgi:hypothetical protein
MYIDFNLLIETIYDQSTCCSYCHISLHLFQCCYMFVYRLFDWRPERMRGEPLKCERVVIIKNLFTPEDFDKEVQLLLEYQQDIRSECLKCGDVRKVVICDVSFSSFSFLFFSMRYLINAARLLMSQLLILIEHFFNSVNDISC